MRAIGSAIVVFLLFALACGAEEQTNIKDMHYEAVVGEDGIARPIEGKIGSLETGEVSEQEPVTETEKSTAGEYVGISEDGSTFRVILVQTNDGILAQEVGYKFKATSIGVERVAAKDGKPFGEFDGKTLSFQIPIIVEFRMSTSLVSESGSSTSVDYVEVAITQAEPDVYSCTLTRIDELNEQYEVGRFKMEDISLGPGGELGKQYTFMLKTAQQQ